MGVLDNFKLNYEDITMTKNKINIKQTKRKRTLLVAIRLKRSKAFGLPIALHVEQNKKDKAIVLSILFIEIARFSFVYA